MHPRALTRSVKWIFWISTGGFLIVQLHIFARSPLGLTPSTETDNGKDGSVQLAPRSVSEHDTLRGFMEERGLTRQTEAEAKKTKSPEALITDSIERAQMMRNFSLEDMRRVLREDNIASRIQNDASFGPPLSVENANLLIQHVIVVQVHNRTKYLEKLIDSLGGASGIANTLLIFSHDFYSPEINKLIKSIRFCRVVQIFYPYSIQLSPNKFPGPDPNDCPATISKDKAKEISCNNWQHPDKYGHYRVARLTQIKHHWWWKTNYVFDGIPQIRNFSGYFLFLEEDHYVSPDFLHVLSYIVKNKERLCNECRVITLGYYLKSYASYGANINKVGSNPISRGTVVQERIHAFCKSVLAVYPWFSSRHNMGMAINRDTWLRLRDCSEGLVAVYPWFSSRHNMGMAINRDTWLRLRDCSERFCKYDDYNWDWSLLHVNLKCLKPGPMSVIYAKAPRVFHIGDCGVHQKGKACAVDKSSGIVLSTLAGVKDSLFTA